PQYPPQYPLQPGAQQYGYPQLAAAHKPGSIPLRPLRLGDIFDGAFKIIRFNPKATVGSAVLVTAVAMMIPIIVTGVLAAFIDISLNHLDDPGSSATSGAGFASAYGATLIGTVLQWFGLIFVTGMITHVAAASTLGQQLSLGQAWAATAGKRARLVGLALLLGAITVGLVTVVVILIVVASLTLPSAAAVTIGILLGLAGVAALVVFWVRVYYLAVPPLMLEPIGIRGALGRSWALTGRQFWRTLGIALLTMLLTSIIGGMLGVPFSIISVIGIAGSGGGNAGTVLFVVAHSISVVVSSAFVAPFTSAVVCLQYVDQRMRKEGYDVELITRAGLAVPPTAPAGATFG
ncbi:MAG: hypothetical protein JWP74_3709, partial [Marmoricola sp.]|nr:hypothetical protein [Marmoricola sp.]